MSFSVSVIVPLYNKQHFVRFALEALIGQLTAIDEIIVIDDRSTDASLSQVISLFEITKCNGHIFKLPTNSGPGTARNVGARNSKGEYLLFFDADDIPSPTLFQDLRSAIFLHPEASIFSYKIAFEARGESSDFETTNSKQLTTHIRSLHSFAIDSLAGSTLCTASSTCVRRDVFLNEAGGFKEGLRYCEDPELWVRLSSQYEVIFIDKTLAVYRDVPSSLSYKLRGLIGSVNPYVDTLIMLMHQHGAIYRKLARSILIKNLIFSRASGAKRLESFRQLYRYRSVLGNGLSLIGNILIICPSIFPYLFLKLRSKIAAQKNVASKELK